VLSGTGRRRVVFTHAFTSARLALLAALCCCLAAACGGGRQEEGTRHFEKGRELRRAGDLAGARTEFERAAELIPDSDNAHYLLGLTLDDLGEQEAAGKALRRALELNPTRAVTHHSYGNVLRRLGDNAGDLREQTEAVRLEPDNVPFLVALGSAQEQAGDQAAAQTSFEHAAALDSAPRVRATAYMRLGYLLAARGEYAKASDALRRGLELDPTDDYARQKLKEVDETRAAGGAGAGTGPPPAPTPPGKKF